MMPYYGYTCNPRKPLAPQLRAAVLAYTDRWQQAPAAIYVREATGLTTVDAVPVLTERQFPVGLIGLVVTPPPTAPSLDTSTNYMQEVLL